MTDLWLITYDFAWFHIIFDTVCFNPHWDPTVFDFFICDGWIFMWLCGSLGMFLLLFIVENFGAHLLLKVLNK